MITQEDAFTLSNTVDLNTINTDYITSKYSMVLVHFEDIISDQCQIGLTAVTIPVEDNYFVWGSEYVSVGVFVLICCYLMSLGYDITESVDSVNGITVHWDKHYSADNKCNISYLMNIYLNLFGNSEATEVSNDGQTYTVIEV